MANAALELVVAVSENDVIGRDKQLPWRLPADLRHFKLLTMGRPILMGRKTYESIGKALPGRVNLVLSRTPGFAPSGCTVVTSLRDAQIAAGAESPLMVIGGAEIYSICMPLAERIHLTLVHTRIDDGDAFFSDWRAVKWHESSRDRFAADEKNPHPYSFITLDRQDRVGG